LNIDLVDLCENRMLRSNERLREVSNGVARDEPAPAWVDFRPASWGGALPPGYAVHDGQGVIAEDLPGLAGSASRAAVASNSATAATATPRSTWYSPRAVCSP
jgi:hypothetical protein